MKYVDPGELIDVREYLSVLPSLERSLPTGAFEFASDPDHYDFYGRRCVKDLSLANMVVSGDPGSLGAVLSFEPNQWKHDERLVIRYEDVVAVDLSVADESSIGLNRLEGLRVDELLPHPRGARHEFAFNKGTLVVVASDLLASWQ